MFNLVTSVSRALEGRHVIGRGFRAMPRLRWVLGASALVALAVACPLLAADVSGNWDIVYWTEQGRQPIALELVQKGSQLSGVGSLRTAGTDIVIRAEVQGGANRSGDFHFLLVEEGGSASRSQQFFGSSYKDEMSGRTSGPFGDAIFAGVRRRVPD
ncbi:MAG: hypothetical protein ACYC6F_18815 [Longimicrobiales bacterium]